MKIQVRKRSGSKTTKTQLNEFSFKYRETKAISKAKQICFHLQSIQSPLHNSIWPCLIQYYYYLESTQNVHITFEIDNKRQDTRSIAGFYI